NGFAKKPDELARRYHITLTSGRGAISDASQEVPNGEPRDVVEMVNNRPTPDRVAPPKPQATDIGSGDVLIAAITSCTNTSNPSVLLAAGLLAKKAVEKGLTVKPHVKTSLAPGSRVVTEYLKTSGLMPYLEKLNFYLAGYGCTTCIANAVPLPESTDPA